MTRAERNANLAGVIVPLVGTIVALVLLRNRAVEGDDVALLVGMYVATGLG